MDFIGLEFATKSDILKKLQVLLKKPEYCKNELVIFKQISNLLNVLYDHVFFLIEYPYVDSHYRDTFYFYHSAKFLEYSRNCIRVHLFFGLDINAGNSFFEILSNENRQYLGFFIVRPLPRYPLGRSLISPVAFKKHNFVCCLMKGKVSLLGFDFEVYGFPHIAQDTETHTCAESSLWTLFEYLGSRYPEYHPLLPSKILNNLSTVTEHRSLPSGGLNITEISKSLHMNDCECIIDPVDSGAEITNFRLFLLKIYIESGIPIYLMLENENNNIGHAILAIGHENASDINVSSKDIWKDVSFFKKSIITINDNVPPYEIVDLETPMPYDTQFKITEYIVPLPKHTNLDANKAYLLTSQIFNDSHVGLKRFGKNWLTRLFLTGSSSFKHFILKHSGLDEHIRNYFLYKAFPKFIWICEIYKAEDFENKICSGLLILDSTAASSPSISTILWYNVDNNWIQHNNMGWTNITPIKHFKMATYQHNLRGEWNGWKI